MAQPFKKPNLNAKRFKLNKKSLDIGDVYRLLIKKYPEHENQSLNTIRKIIDTFSEVIREEIIEFRDGVELPEHIGVLFIGICQASKKNMVDFGKSIKTGVKVTYHNMHTDGKQGKIFYSNYANNYMFKNRDMWEFEGHRHFTRAVSKSFTDNWKKYVAVDPKTYVNKLFKNRSIKHYMKSREKYDLLDYNEFELE